LSGSPERDKQTISPAERWLLVRENAYVRAQRRGFMGGNPFEDWVSAEHEIDSKYVTDAGGVISLTDSAVIADQVKSILSGYGLGDLSVDTLLQRHGQCMDKLARFNRTVVESTSNLAQRQASLAQDALSEAVNTLQSVAQGKVSTDGVARQAALSMKAMENAMSHLTALTEAMTGISCAGKTDDSSRP
jgi:hypothetical protein